MRAVHLALGALLLVGSLGCGSPSGSGSGGDANQALSQPIIGGHTDTTTKGVVALAFKSRTQVSVFCSGSLLTPNLVLTARHCIARIGDGSSEAVECDSSAFTARYDPRQIFVSADAQPQAGGQLYGVREIREAPGSSNVCGYDIALLILSGAGVAGTVATPIEPVLDARTLPKAHFSAVGYGLQDPNDTAGTTAGSRMRFDSSSVYCVGANCPAAADTADDEFVGNSPVCSGDSGGPALDLDGRVFGVTSRGDSACTYALYSSVADWSEFVRSTARDAAVIGGYAPAAWVNGSGTAAGSGASGGSAGMNTNTAGSAGSNANNPPAAAGTSSSSAGSSSAAGGAPAGTAGSTSETPPPVRGTPTVDATGAACSTTSDCPGTYQCYSATKMPPGICVPLCTANGAACPNGYSCTASLGVCTPEQAAVTETHVSTSCAFSPGTTPPRGTFASWAALAVGFVWLRRRRRNPE